MVVIAPGVGKGMPTVHHVDAGKIMLTLIKLVAGTVLALSILTPRADTCECKAKANAAKVVPQADTCECKAKA